MSSQADVWQGQYDKLFIAGLWVPPASDRVFEVISPSTEQLVTRAPQGVEADVDGAVSAARDAFDRGPWPRMALDERIATLGKLSEQLADTVDVVTVLSGELYAVTETGETLLKPGDTWVTRGVKHIWSNRTNEPVLIVATMMAATR